MKSLKYIIGFLALAFGLLASCSDPVNNLDLSNRQFVRIDQSSVYMTLGEKIKVTASVDDIKGDGYKLVWSILDTDIASIETRDGNVGVITALSAGSTVIKVETDDHKLMYFADLTISTSTRPLNILTIGTGMSCSIADYLHIINKDAGLSSVISNAYIEGASFADHAKNLEENLSVYNISSIDTEGETSTKDGQSLKNIIKSNNWDYVILEESLAQAGNKASYGSNLNNLLEAIDTYATNPEVSYFVHQPWAYAESATSSDFGAYGYSQEGMYKAIAEAVGESLNLDKISGVIPSGTAVQNLRTSYLGESVLYDEIKLSTLAMYSVACAWAKALNSSISISFMPGTLIQKEGKLAQDAATEAIRKIGGVTELTKYEKAPSRIYIDFGPEASPAPFNNYLKPTDPAVKNLLDDRGDTTPFGIVTTKAFSGTLNRSSCTNNLGYPLSSSRDMFFSDGVKAQYSTSSLQLFGLNPDERYLLILYGNINDKNVETEFHIVGTNEGIGYLANGYNYTETVNIGGIQPKEDGTVDIKMQPGPKNTQWAKFFGINIMIIIPEGYVDGY